MISKPHLESQLIELQQEIMLQLSNRMSSDFLRLDKRFKALAKYHNIDSKDAPIYISAKVKENYSDIIIDLRSRLVAFNNCSNSPLYLNTLQNLNELSYLWQELTQRVVLLDFQSHDTICLTSPRPEDIDYIKAFALIESPTIGNDALSAVNNQGVASWDDGTHTLLICACHANDVGKSPQESNYGLFSYMDVSIDEKSQIARINWLGTALLYQGNACAKLMLLTVLKQLHDIGITAVTLSPSEAALALYIKSGFLLQNPLLQSLVQPDDIEDSITAIMHRLQTDSMKSLYHQELILDFKQARCRAQFNTYWAQNTLALTQTCITPGLQDSFNLLQQAIETTEIDEIDESEMQIIQPYNSGSNTFFSVNAFPSSTRIQDDYDEHSPVVNEY